MALTNNAETIWNFLLAEYKNPYGVAGLMGNLYAESKLNPKNLQNSYSKKLGLTDEEYTEKVDKGTYSNFVNDSAGYGLAQWTYSSRKLNLLTYAKNKKTSIGDLNTQLSFLVKELAGYNSVITAIKNAKSIQEASDIVLTKYERPANQSEEVKQKRASYGLNFYTEFFKKEVSSMGQYDKYINSTGTHYISNSGSDEKGNYTGGSAGDQTGKEWQIRSWYNRPWTHVLRYEKNEQVGKLLAELGCAAALNENIGYDQWQRTTYWKQLQTVNYDPSKISVKCEEDCSAGVAANIKAVGYILNIKDLQNVSSSMTSRNTISQLQKAGFTILTDSKYRSNGDYLKPGDILLYENHHLATNITKGKKANEDKIEVIPEVIEKFTVIGTATAKANMFIRSEANASSKSYGNIYKGKTLEVIEVLKNGWYKVIWKNSPTGYGYTSNVNNKYYLYKATNITTKKATGVPSLKNTTLVGTYKTTGSVNVRNNAGIQNNVIVIIPKNTKVICEGKYSTYKNTKWYYVSFNYKSINYEGFISSEYLERI